MSRAFVKEDPGGGPERRYSLPDPGSPYYPEAAAWALLQGADEGDSRGAELATGFRWGDPALRPHMEKILEEVSGPGSDRVRQLARRYLRAAARHD